MAHHVCHLCTQSDHHQRAPDQQERNNRKTTNCKTMNNIRHAINGSERQEFTAKNDAEHDRRT